MGRWSGCNRRAVRARRLYPGRSGWREFGRGGGWVVGCFCQFLLVRKGGWSLVVVWCWGFPWVRRRRSRWLWHCMGCLVVVVVVEVAGFSSGEAGRLRVGVVASWLEGLWGGWLLVSVLFACLLKFWANWASRLVRFAVEGRLVGVAGGDLAVMVAAVWRRRRVGKPGIFSWMLVGVTCMVPMVHCR